MTQEPIAPLPPPLVIVGPTASGKSGLALALAGRVPGARIISADAMAVYRGMDIGTAKPTLVERASVRHYLIDTTDPREEYDVARFQGEVNAALADCDADGVPVILVGGTGLYVRAVVDAFRVPPRYPHVRAELELEPNSQALWVKLCDLDPVAASKMEPSNRRRILRALEVCVGSGQPFSSFGPGVDTYPPTRFIQVGLEIQRDAMDQRINRRYDQQMVAGFVSEVQELPTDLSRTASQALGYRELLLHLDGECTLADALETAKLRTRRLARRQQRWFRRDPRIRWFDVDSPHLVQDVERFWLSRNRWAGGTEPARLENT